MKDRTMEQTPSRVPATAPQDGEIRPAPAGWVEPTVWTERMLTTLETGIEGGKWFRLIDKVWSPKNLGSSLEKVVAKGGSAGVDNQSASQIEAHKEQTIAKLEQELRASQYRPQAVKRVWIPKAGSKEKRPLGVPTLRDRIIQGALLHVMEPIFERDFAPQSYGFRPGKGCKDALRRVDELLESGYHWVVDADLKGYFDSIPQEGLMERVGEKIADGVGRRDAPCRGYGECKGMATDREGDTARSGHQPIAIKYLPGRIGLEDGPNGTEMVRYADDFILLCRNQQEAEKALEQVQRWVEENGLQLHPTKTRLVNAKANVLEDIDAYVRGRLRSILRKRNKKKGRGRGSDHQRWPNAYFTTKGLYSLKQAHAVARQSFAK